MRLLMLLLTYQIFVSAVFAQDQSLKSGFADRGQDVENAAPSGTAIKGLLSQVNEQVVKEMDRAWRASGGGTDNKEIVVLLFRMSDGSLAARVQGVSNQHKEFTFKWNPAAIAILHTHPNVVNPKPSKADKQIADKLGVPILTLTSRGMYMYDPGTKSVSEVKKGLDWLEPSQWSANLAHQ